MPKMAVTLVTTMTNDNKLRTMNYPKQTQTKPILDLNLVKMGNQKRAPLKNKFQNVQ